MSWEQWRELEQSPPAFGTFNARRLPAGSVVLAVDHLGRRHILLPLPTLDEGFEDTRSRGLTVTTHGLEVDGEKERPFLDICCTDASGHDAFNLVATMLLTELSSGNVIADAVRDTIGRWRRFWSAPPEEGLTAEEIRGLFGELWFLLVWLLPHGSQMVDTWVGPSGARHDFQWSDLAVESKATMSGRGHIHRINGLDQLDPPEHGQLMVFSLRIRPERSSTNSVVTLVSTIRDALASDPAACDRFDSRLATVGYSDTESAVYGEMRFRIADERLYHATGQFPRISASSFSGGVPRGVERIEYEINLDAIESLDYVQRPAEFTPPPG